MEFPGNGSLGCSGYGNLINAERMMFEIFLNDTSKVIFTLDSAGEILAVNPYVEKNFGYTPEELLGQSIDVLIPVNMLNSAPGLDVHLLASAQFGSCGTRRTHGWQT